MSYATDARGIAREFEITVGLREGFAASATIHSIETVRRVIRDWVFRRASRELPYLSGIVTEARIVFAKGGRQPEEESVAIFSGQVDVLAGATLGDSDVEALLNDLSDQLGETLRQEQVYIRYRTDAWIRTRTG
jgi:hypothetical protein